MLRDHGRIARFHRELSPIQVGVRGRWGGRSFVVVGVVRRARARVRWNEWYLRFDDGKDGWLGEGNGLYQLFDRAEPRPDAQFERLRAGREALTDPGGAWITGEVSSASVVAAEGELPYAVQPGVPVRYADLRRRDGLAVATLDFDDTPPTLWTGKVVSLPALEPQGLRPFAGWSDPALTNFAGPEITNVRRLACPSCGATLTLRAPGQTIRVACDQCGRPTDVDPDDEGVEAGPATARRIAQIEAKAWLPPLPLGARGTLSGIPWEVIGAMERFVHEEGIDYIWTEILLHNPYRGFAWLVQEVDRHWSYVELLPCLPAAAGRLATYQRQPYRFFQAGPATVRRVLGEFTWEVATGDKGTTADYVAPPRMLSMEATDEEVVWSLGAWLPAAEVAAAFKVELPTPVGIAAHQPNPFRDPTWLKRTRGRQIALLLGAVLTLLLAVVLPAREPLLDWTTVEPRAGSVAPPLDEAGQVSPPFTVPDTLRGTTTLTVHATAPSTPTLIVSFIRTDADEVVDWTFVPAGGSAQGTFRLSPGAYVVRVGSPLPISGPEGTVSLSLVRDAPTYTLPLLLLVYSAIGLVLAGIDAGRFEGQRWSTSSGTPPGGEA